MTEQDDRQARLDEAVNKIRDAARQLVEAFARLGEAATKALRTAGELLAIWRAAWPSELPAATGRPLPAPRFDPNGWPFRADPPGGGWRGP